MIGYALGSEFNSEGKRFTGRHWWGVKSNSLEDPDSVDPLIDERPVLTYRKIRNFERPRTRL